MKKKKKIRTSFFVMIALILSLVILVPLFSQWIGGCFSDFYKDNVIPRPYSGLVSYYSEEYSVPSSVIYAVMKTESGFQPDAVSSAGAVGLMQLMPDTFEWMNKHSKSGYISEQISDPKANIHIAVYYLSWLYSKFEDWELVYAAYNAGHNRVKQWLEDPQYTKDGKLVYIPFRETENYVKKVTRYREEYLIHYPQFN